MVPAPPLPVEIVAHGWPWSATWAGVQALGALAALGLALWLPRLEEHRDRRRLRETVLANAGMVRDAVHALALYAGDFTDVVYRTPLQQASVELKLPMLFAAAERLPLDRLRSAKATVAFIKLLGAAQTYHEELKRPPGEMSPMDLINGETPRRFAAQRVLALYEELEGLLATGPSRMFHRPAAEAGAVENSTACPLRQVFGAGDVVEAS